ncbi:MAG: hypothetical protein HDR01_01000 [Lachnospiraceae bacterium]|nr:hypothetical protein [Lachnospiraceae bacterium]
MNQVIYKLRKTSNWIYTGTLIGLYIVLIIVYLVSISDLVKPAGMIEVVNFYIKQPGDYATAIIAGMLISIIPFLFLGMSLGSVLNIVTDYSDDYTDDVYIKRKKILFFANGILTIITAIANRIALKSLMALILTFIFVIVIVYVFIKEW